MDRNVVQIIFFIFFSISITQVVGIGGDGNCTGVYQNFTKCILDEYDSVATILKENVTKALGVYLCGKGMLATCTASLTKNLTKCFKVMDSYRIYGNVKAMKRFVEYLCENEGQRIVDMHKVNGQDCLRGTTGESFKSKCKDYPVLFNYFNGKDEDCNKKRNASACIVNALEGCKAANVSVMIKNLLGEYIAASPCGGAGCLEIGTISIGLALMIALLQKYII